MENLLQVGVITTTHGVRGEVKVFPTTDDAVRFKKLKKVIVDNGKEQRELEVAAVKFFKNLVILKFKGINDINEVEKYRKAGLWITREQAVPLEENEYFIADLIGLRAISDEGEDLGTVKAAIEKSQSQDEIPLFENMDTLTVQFAFVMAVDGVITNALTFCE